MRVREIADARAWYEPTELEDYGQARKYVFHDPDGNEIGVGQIPSGPRS